MKSSLNSIKNIKRSYSLKKIPYVEFSNVLWVKNSGVISPIGPAIWDYSLNAYDAIKIMKELKGWILFFTDGFDLKNYGKGKCDEYYAVIQDEFIPLEKLSSNTRSKLRRGFKRCEVKKVPIELIANHGYEVYIEAFKRYKGTTFPKITPEVFKNNMLLTARFSDTHHYWGVFCQNKLAAYAHVLLFDKIEASYTHFKFHPYFLKFYTSYILVYKMNEYYLGNSVVKYVNDGFKSVYHLTYFQEFLIQKFKFKKAYTNLHLVIHPFLQQLAEIVYFTLKNFPPQLLPNKLRAFLKLLTISKKCTYS